MVQIEADAAFRRIDALPRRLWTREAGEAAQAYYTAALKKPHGQQTLRLVQASAVHDTIASRGFFGPISVGGGKTLYSFLSFVGLNAKRPLLLLPGALVKRTMRDAEELRRHWYLPKNLSIESYDKLSRVEYVDLIKRINPDVIVADEAHRLKNRDAACTKRVARYLESNQDTIFCGVSGTLLSKDLRDFAHLSAWALREKSPIPYEVQTLAAWVNCLDDSTIMAPHPGVLLQWAPEGIAGTLRARARMGIRDRLIQTSGVVVSLDEGYSGALDIQGTEIQIPEKVKGYYRTLRNEWLTPDGWELLSPVDVWRHARELALGFHYVWDPRPPREWLNARGAWGRHCRAHLGQSAEYDTEHQLKLALRSGECDDVLARAALASWTSIEPTFTPNVVAVWHDTWSLDYCEKWSKKPGIIWTDHVLFAKELAKRTGLSYYGNNGEDALGNEIEQHDPRKALIASVDANCTGRNLQAWHRNLIVTPRSNHKVEQLLGRTHRSGQLADGVTVDVLYGCRENILALHRAVSKSQEVAQLLGAKQKILLATLDWPTAGELSRMHGAQYKEGEGLSKESLLSILDETETEEEEES